MALLPLAALITAGAPAVAGAQAPGLPRTYNATVIESPAPVGGGAFGWGIYSADLTEDGKQDLLVAQSQVGTVDLANGINEPNRIFIFNGATGAHIDTIAPPEENPPNVTATNPSGYVSPEMGFVYIETMPDLGSCPGGDGGDPDKICDLANIARGDGIPEILVGSRALKVNKDNGATPATNADRPVGRGYVIDGKTRAVLKRIDMPVADRQHNAIFGGSPAFGRTMASPQGMPPCAGEASENNDTGVGPCPPLLNGTANTTTGSPTLTNADIPGVQVGMILVGAGIPLGARVTDIDGTSLTFRQPVSGTAPTPATATKTGVALQASDYRYPQAVRIGDLDGGGKPDIVITARGFPEAGKVITNTGAPLGTGENTAAAGSHCRNSTLTQAQPTAANPNPSIPSCSAGKAWTYRGEAIAGSNPQTILDTPMYTPSATLPNGGLQNPDSQTAPAGGEWGGNMFRVGDVVGDDGFPDFIIPSRGADFPLKSPDLPFGQNMGAAYLFNGRTGALARTIVSPEPQQRAQFSGNFNAGRAVGDLGATEYPDILLPAPLHNALSTDDGKLWVFNGDTTAGGGGEGSWQFASLTDPEPQIGGNFGGGMTGVGNVVDGPGAPANELLLGGFRFDTFTEGAQQNVGNVNFMNATLQKNLMTIPAPDGARGDGFGVGITPMGDLNNDGFLDFSVSSYLANTDRPDIGRPTVGGAGRAWIFKSDNSPAPAPPKAPAPAAPAAVPAPAVTIPVTRASLLQAGGCTNRGIGTERGELIKGTLAGDELFAFGGNDTILAYEGEDCVDAGSGSDKVMAGNGNDKIIGGTGGDNLSGQDGRDELFGGSRKDRLYGGYGRDMIAGGSGNDLIVGGFDADRLFGEDGKDRIVAGDGRNYVDAGDGNDSIDVRNGELDRVLCGRGRDRVQADRIDRLNSCEIVTFKKAKTR
ncbi:MAG: hypothetical protein H0W96_03245 [Solirubrobacterales bacterium]|nr:hypothetical protein [Solirubrobacterales bacterium]